MTAVARMMVNLLADDVEKLRDFYTGLLGMKVHFDSDWYVILVPDNAATDAGHFLELGILQRSHAIAPEAARGQFGGAYLTFVVDDVDAVFARAQELGAVVIEAPVDLFYGQRRAIIRDPEGTLVDLSAPTAPAPSP